MCLRYPLVRVCWLCFWLSAVFSFCTVSSVVISVSGGYKCSSGSSGLWNTFTGSWVNPYWDWRQCSLLWTWLIFAMWLVALSMLDKGSLKTISYEEACCSSSSVMCSLYIGCGVAVGVHYSLLSFTEVIHYWAELPIPWSARPYVWALE
jgi:hypothetical protein